MTAQAANKVPANLAETFYTLEGDQILYIPVAKRIAYFLGKYPPEEFAIISEVKQVQGRFIVETRLNRLEDDKTIANAHSSGIPCSTEHKELERLETASLQRLMARLGYGGDVFDADEALDFKITKLTPTPKAPPAVIEEDDTPAPVVKPVQMAQDAVRNPEEKPTVSEAQAEPVVASNPTEEIQEAAPVASAVDSVADEQPIMAPAGDLVDQAQGASSDAPAAPAPRQQTRSSPKQPMSDDAKAQAKLNNLRKQVEQMALRKGVTAPTFNTIEEGSGELRKLLRG